MGVYYEYFTGGRAVHLEPEQVFSTPAAATDEIRRALRRIANHECQKCKGEGIYPVENGLKLCRCVPVY